jgi:hypothetical protein
LLRFQFCFHAAVRQLSTNRRFFAEQLCATWMAQVDPQPRLMNRPNPVAKVIDQCRLGVNGENNFPVKKPTSTIASAVELVEPFDNLRCEGRCQIHDGIVLNEWWKASGGSERDCEGRNNIRWFQWSPQPTGG